MPDSDSEDDFMSDKFLVEAPAPAQSKSYSERRNQQSLRSMRTGQAKNLQSLKALEEERRREGLNRSLFEDDAGPSTAPAATAGGPSRGTAMPAAPGKNKAMEMMMKMGWTVGQGLGRRRSASPDNGVKRARVSPSQDAANDDDEEEEDGRPRGGIGSSRPSLPAKTATQGGGRTEPVRISLWAGRRGLAARSPSPPPLRSSSSRDPDALDPKKLARLGRQTDDFRSRQREEYKEKEVERKERKARELLVEFDEEKGIKFHPLHILPTEPLETLPRPLLKLIYPAQAISPSPGPSRSPSPPLTGGVQGYDRSANVSQAERLREQMRRDMLSAEGAEIDDEDEDEDLDLGLHTTIKSAISSAATKTVSEAEKVDYNGVDWGAHVSGTKKVLAMDPETHLTFLLDQLRHEHFFCFWCSHKYRSWEDMQNPGGCPGEDEDDH